MKTKKLLMLIGSICLSLVLAALLLPACAPVEVPEEIAKLEVEIADLKDDVAAEKTKTAAEKAKVSDLEDEITALKKPAEVHKWYPSSWQSAGPVADDLAYMCEHITAMSDGRIVATPSAPGAICPVDEQLDAVIAGSTEAMNMTSSYTKGKIPCSFAHQNFAYLTGGVHDAVYFYEEFEGGRVMEIFQEELTKYGDAVVVGNHYFYSCNNIVSAVPIYGVAELEGVMFRTSEIKADLVSHFGAGTVWLPGDEIYTSLATGAVDAMTYSNVLTNLAMSFHEVSKYWIKKPLMSGILSNQFVVNGDVWRGLPDDLKDIVRTAIRAGTARGQWVCDRGFASGWKQAEAAGIEIIEWPAEDIATFLEAYAMLYKEGCQVDAPSQEIYGIYERFLAEVGG